MSVLLIYLCRFVLSQLLVSTSQPPELETMSTPPPATQQMPVKVQEEEFTIHIHRDPGQGLGISIAGGKGSTPVRGDDEVRLFCLLFFC